MTSQEISRLQELPKEILDDILLALDVSEIKTIRLASPLLCDHAAVHLYENIRVRTSHQSVVRFRNICVRNGLRHQPKTVTFLSGKASTFRWADDNSEFDLEDEEVKDYFRSIESLAQLPNVDTVEICFSELSIGVDCWVEPQNGYDNRFYREHMLRVVFQAILSHNARQENRRIGSLKLHKLQNMPLPDFTASELFHSVMSNVQSLYIYSQPEMSRDDPGTDIFWPERRAFDFHLAQDWLRPFGANLRYLTLSSADRWGAVPGAFISPSDDTDASNSDPWFPSLVSLELTGYTIHYADQLDWIPRHAPNLTRLILNYCSIASHVYLDRLTRPPYAISTRGWTPIPRLGTTDPADDNTTTAADEATARDPASPGWWRCDVRWADIFTRLAAPDALPHLETFAFWRFRVRCVRADDGKRRTYLCASNMDDDRYVVFDEADRDGAWLGWARRARGGVATDGDEEGNGSGGGGGDEDGAQGDGEAAPTLPVCPAWERGRETSEEDTKGLMVLINAIHARKGFGTG